MYLRKCWRDTSIMFFGLLLIFVLFVLLVTKDRGPHSPPHGQVSQEIFEAWRELGASMVMLTSLLGTRSIGADISKGFGDFLVTRPRARKYFVWAGWAVGVVEIACLIASMVVLLVAILYQENGPFWRNMATAVTVDQKTVTLDPILAILSIFVGATAAYSFVYFVCLATRRTATLPAIFVVILYYLPTGSRGWVHSHLPAPLVQPYFALASQQISATHIDRIYSLTLWGLCALLFPLLAQIAFERMDS
jgi:hypothetical protein